MKQINLSNLKEGTPGISPIEGANLYENCIVALHQNQHSSPVTLQMQGIKSDDIPLCWEDMYDEQLARTYKDEQSVTERAAVGISVLLVLSETDYTIIERSRKGSGFDYMLGMKEDTMFTPKARLEVSGIMKENLNNTLAARYRNKVAQVSKSDNRCLPAYISIIELNTPKALFKLK